MRKPVLIRRKQNIARSVSVGQQIGLQFTDFNTISVVFNSLTSVYKVDYSPTMTILGNCLKTEMHTN